MSWRDNSSSSNRSSTNDGSGGSRSGSGSTSGTGGGGNSNYGFRGTKTGQGNWNTGGQLKGYGNIDRGITPVGRQAIPTQPTGRATQPIQRPPVQTPPVQYPPVSGPPTRVDLNPATLAPWTGVGLDPLAKFRNPNGNYPAQYNGGGPGRSFNSRKDQSRHPGMGGNGPAGRSGGGWGGGGGGGWAKGGNVDKPSILKQILARSKGQQKSAIPAGGKKVTQKVTSKKTPWKKPAAAPAKPAFAKGGAVEKFMAKYPNFKLT